jgi:signal transduction histidine kinase/DNA-binding response OmpR family regulator
MTTEEQTNILVVDDLPEKLLVYRTILDELNLNLITAGSGEEALRAVLAHDFAVILMDVNMPGMNGLETAALIRRRKRSAHTPIIFLTAFADEVRVAEGYEQGAVDYISTPVVPAILRAKVRVFADLSRMTQQVRRQAEERVALAEERSRREAAEEANQRLAFLTSVGAVLGGSLDQDVTAQDVVRFSLSYLADTAAIVTFPLESCEPRVLCGRLEEGVPALDAPGGSEALSPEVWETISRAATGTIHTSEAEAVVAVPLQARDEVLGVLWLSRQPSGRSFPAADIAVAQAFASRAAMALENARLYSELQQVDRQKNEFLSMLAHELRNPLAPIRNANEMLHQSGGEPERVRWAHGVIDRQLTHLVRLVDDLLDVSRLTLGKIRLTVDVVDLETVLTQAIEATRPLIDKLQHNLEVTFPDQPVRMQGDPARLIQVFANLLNNAAKYTDPGGCITLTTAIKTGSIPTPDGFINGTTSSFVEIRLRDTGVGISRELLPTVFDLFTQANRSLDRSQGGLGIGLTLVRRLVEMHGGTVEAYSEGIGCGSEFVVQLPATPDRMANVPPATQVNEQSLPPQALRVVLVDDNVDGVESLADLISLFGHEVRIAHDGPTGLQVIRDFDPDVVLLDIGLPGMNGHEVARRIRGEPGHRAMLIAVSGYGRDEDRALSLEAGCAQHLVKPIEFGVLQTLFASVPRPGERV